MTKRIAIIGAGPSGMAQLRAFESAAKKGHEMPEIVCYEKQDDWGGQWNFTWRTGTDQYGEPVHTSMYRNLWSNGPKEGLEFAEYTFDEHFGRPVSSYPPREALWDYIAGRAEKSDVKKFVKFAHAVRWVDFDEESKTFTVNVENLRTGETEANEFDHVIVASGHFTFPNVPHFEGIDTFPGQIVHAHEFRGAEALADKDILLIGASYSAEDIGTQAFKMGARSVTFSYRSAPMGFDWPEGMEEQPLVEKFDGNTVHFSNGLQRKFDAVILCTGYIHHYPFLPESLSLDSPNNVYPDNLYRGVVWEKNNQMFYLGAQDQWFTFNMFDAQAWYVRDVILGERELPSKEEQRKSIDAWLERFDKLDSMEDQVDFQGAYVRDLIEQTDYPMFDLDTVCGIFKEWIQSKRDDILNYRDVTYTSVMTGTKAAQHHTPWMLELDDSLERYLSTPARDDARDVFEGREPASKRN
ncbi:NAD(P)/FAD-dependent oxidoreductase [Corynebacterium sp. YIM 101645]|uniref:NAD(P)/FAD-dependent oxidoreductase n=2 Tax=Corynebacterium lemuris TaxID=1859292 RepID=A0ABT2FUL1_9CORY|nr:NAD(P)/FAD-dependent oxidoreductase [Corynebacterium lemuris]MCS5478922.1 NAD(P)/FAD-dependent oxidoreductase [Corynebacterium lemuris]